MTTKPNKKFYVEFAFANSTGDRCFAQQNVESQRFGKLCPCFQISKSSHVCDV